MNAMKTSQTETNHTSKRRGRRFWIGCSTLLLSLPLLYYGYCWGLWGRSSLLLQYLFQCSCPPASEEARYPEQVDVIVPACHYRSSIISPSGRWLYVQEEERSLSYLLDLQTNKKIPFTLGEGSNHFLTDDLLFLSLYYGQGYEGGEYIFDRTTREQYPIRSLVFLRPDAYIDVRVNTGVLASELQNAKDIFLIGNDTIVALTSDFHISPEHNFYIDQADLPGYEENRAEQFLQQNNIDYHFAPENFPSEVLSPDGRFIARKDGIYLTSTGQKIVDAYSSKGFWRPYSGEHFSVRGWIFDSSGVIYSKFLEPCLIEIVIPTYDEPGCFITVPQPLVKLKVPEEYLLSQDTP